MGSRLSARSLLRAALGATGVLAALAPAAPAATVAADAGSLRAVVGEDPWSLSLRSRGEAVLLELPGGGPGPSGTLGFRSAGVWHHATRVSSSNRAGDAFRAVLATDDPLRSIAVRLTAGREGVIRLSAELVGPATGVAAMGIAFQHEIGDTDHCYIDRCQGI